MMPMQLTTTSGLARASARTTLVEVERRPRRRAAARRATRSYVGKVVHGAPPLQEGRRHLVRRGQHLEHLVAEHARRRRGRALSSPRPPALPASTDRARPSPCTPRGPALLSARPGVKPKAAWAAEMSARLSRTSPGRGGPVLDAHVHAADLLHHARQLVDRDARRRCRC